MNIPALDPAPAPTPASRRSRRPRRTVGLGLALVATGILALLAHRHLFETALLRLMAPLALVAWGLARWLSPRRGRAFGGLLMAAGLVLAAQQLGWVSLRWQEAWPVAVIAVGLALMTGYRRR